MVRANEPGSAPERYGLIGESQAIQRVLRTIRKLRSDVSPVLITGESGVGKELVAKAIQRCSPLAGRVFLPVDSASLVGSLLESELFGHVKGAFTGAEQARQGLVRAADGGTLFLDEVGELTPEVQAKLLRLLQEGEIRPLGSTKPIPVTVRILAATNRDLEAEVRALRFRKDLFYRLNVIPIQVPPLRERREDIPLLARHFVERHALHRVAVSDSVMQAFQAYSWPGNVRELENAVRRVVALKSNPVVQLEDLPASLRNFAAALRGEAGRPEDVLPLAEVERRHILHAVESTKGDLQTAALILGIGRTTLYRKLKQYREAGLDRDETEMTAPAG